jgi:ABC-type transport system involved in multi-copper enzyme maturation permease subunit
MIRGRHLELIAKHAVRHSVRGGAGLIAIFSTLVIGLIMASIVMGPLEAIDQEVARQGGDRATAELLASDVTREVVNIAKKAMGWAMGASEAQVDYLVHDKPALISAILILLMLVAPACACLGAFNQTSGDISTKGLRFLLIRTERPNIFLGRFLGTALFTAAVFAVLIAILAVYVLAKVDVHAKGDMLLWLAGGYLRLVLFALPYVALCAWISGAIDSPFGSLVLALTITYVWPLVVMIGSRTNEAFGHANFITPWGFKWWLFSEQAWKVGAGALVMLGFTALLVWVGLRQFKKRDL